MHRNAEIWENRHNALWRMRGSNWRHAEQALSAAKDANTRDRIEMTRDAWIDRWTELERRVWHALCVAKGWRRA